MKYKDLFLFTTVLILLLCSCNSQKPNIVLIMADDLGYGDLRAYNSGSQIFTPSIDMLAEQGVLFTSYYSNGAVCSPTRAALMTGRYQQRSGVEGVITAAGHRHTGMALSETTLAEVLSEAGYRTGIFGKWHLGYQAEYGPVFQGFDQFKGYVSGNVDFYSHIDQAGYLDWWNDSLIADEEGYTTDLITNHAVDFIRENNGEPFFLYIPHEAPHAPYQGRSDTAYRSIGKPRLPSIPLAKRQAIRSEMIEIMDQGIGEVISVLEEKGLTDNTYIIFCSDNGANSTGSNWPLKGHKGSLLEGGIRVPAIITGPGIKSKNYDGVTLSMDLFPTILKIAGIKRKDLEFDGVDMFGNIMSGNLYERATFWRFGSQKVVRSGYWKYFSVDGKEKLYNLRSDITEKSNCIDSNKSIADSLRIMLKDWESELSKYEILTK